MLERLDQIASRVEDLMATLSSLRAENRQLRADLTQSDSRVRLLEGQLHAVRDRLVPLIDRLPAEPEPVAEADADALTSETSDPNDLSAGFTPPDGSGPHDPSHI